MLDLSRCWILLRVLWTCASPQLSISSLHNTAKPRLMVAGSFQNQHNTIFFSFTCPEEMPLMDKVSLALSHSIWGWHFNIKGRRRRGTTCTEAWGDESNRDGGNQETFGINEHKALHPERENKHHRCVMNRMSPNQHQAEENKLDLCLSSWKCCDTTASQASSTNLPGKTGKQDCGDGGRKTVKGSLR